VVTSSFAVAVCLSGLVIVSVAVNDFAPTGVQVTISVAVSLKSSLTGVASLVSFVTVAVAPAWKLAPRTVICIALPMLALFGDREAMVGAGVLADDVAAAARWVYASHDSRRLLHEERSE
jgi:hypothetical protein